MKLISLSLFPILILCSMVTGMAYAQENESENDTLIEKPADIKKEGSEERLIYDYRTRIGIYISGSLVDLVGGDDSYGSTPFSIGRSSSTEIGVNWKTRVFESSNYIRLKYGLSIQWNKLAPRGNKYLVDDKGINTLEEYPSKLKKSELRFTNLVVPLYIEFGPSKKINDQNYITFSSREQLKVGLGGYAGFNIGSMQKLKYKETGITTKNKIKRDYNTTGFVYGVGAYIGYDVFSVFAKYDLSPLFKNQPEDKHLLSLGLRIDLD